MQTTQTYTVRRYNDAKEIGSVELTAEQVSRYDAMAQQPQGIIALGDLPHDLYELDEEYQDTPASTVVYLELDSEYVPRQS